MFVLSKHNVVIAACNNSLKNGGISKTELVTCVEVVPAGIVELIQKQQAGYAYIKL